MFTKTRFTLCWLVLLSLALTACARRPKFVAPEIEPPIDLIPGYVPKGFKLISGFELEVENLEARVFASDASGREVCIKDLIKPFFALKSPVGENIIGVYYESRDQILLITKSLFPAGTFDLWRTNYEASYQTECDCDCDCGCDCLQIAIDIPPVPFRVAEIKEVRTIGETQVAILENPAGWITVFVRDDYLLTVEGGLPLEDNIKIIESLLE